MHYTTIQKLGVSSTGISVQEYGPINVYECLPEAIASDVLHYHKYKC